VDVGGDIEGFVPLSQLGVDDLKKPGEAFLPDETLTLKVTRVDVPNHRLVLSVRSWLQDQDDVTLAEWTAGRNKARALAAEAEKAEAAKAETRTRTKDRPADEEVVDVAPEDE